LNFKNTVQLCPTIVQSPHRTCASAASPAGSGAHEATQGARKNVGRKPLHASSTKTPTPKPSPSVLATLVAPILPLFTFLMSTPARFATRNPNGIEPARYAASGRNT